jgi:hypothetical protein
VKSVDGPLTDRVGSIEIQTHVVNWNDLDGSTSLSIPTGEFSEHLYVNPMVTIWAPPECPHAAFVQQARKAQVGWNKYFAQVLGRSVLKRQKASVDRTTRELIFTGILFLDGKLIHPKAWPDAQAMHGGQSMTSQSM